MKLFTALLLLAFTCAAETKPPEPKAKTETIKRTTRVVIVRAPVRYYGYNLLGNLIGSGIVGAIEGHRVRAEARAAAYVPPAYVAQQYAEPPALAEIRVESDQPGAEVFIDAKSYGPAPVSVLLNPGARYVAVHLNGFENWSKEIDARLGEPQSVSAELKKPAEDLTVIVVKPGH